MIQRGEAYEGLLHGPWTDIGEGQCQRCRVVRTLYRPHAKPELALCAPCTQVKTISSIPNHSRVQFDDEA